jgi:hypothetical protein
VSVKTEIKVADHECVIGQLNDAPYSTDGLDVSIDGNETAKCIKQALPWPVVLWTVTIRWSRCFGE